MSRAFVKDHEDDAAGSELPDRLISPHRNLVTPAGLAAIEAELHRLGEEISAARARDDRASLASLKRELRYWSQRRMSAEVIPAPSDHSKVRFGSRVTLRGAGTTRCLQIVGEDEAAPAVGRLSWVSPVAQGLLGAAVGDHVDAPGGEAEVIAID
jgi:transcription elongation GreA/GreB family factor